MKHEIKKNLFIVLVGGLLVFALNFANAAWTDPTGAGPDNNVDLPVTSLFDAQVKNGNLSVGTFLASGASEFQQHTFFPGVVKGVDTTGADGTLKVGGVGATGSTSYVDATATGNVHSDKTLGSVELVTQDKRKLCADDEGHVVFCPQLAPTVVRVEGFNVTAQPVIGGTVDTNAVCGAQLSDPAPEDIDINIGYRTNFDNNVTTGPTQYCSVGIQKGQTYGTDYPGRELTQGPTSLVITDQCYIGNASSNTGSSIIDDSSVSPRC